MTVAERNALLRIALLAVLTDEALPREREEIRRAVESLPDSAALDLPQIVQDAVSGDANSEATARELHSPALCRLAFELAIGACNADRLRTPAETLFLAKLGQSLGLSSPAMSEAAFVADALASLPLDSGRAAPTSAAEVDGVILDFAILAGALDLLPHAVASLAIVALQLKLVHRVGKVHGCEFDKGRIAELLAAMGVGPTGQYLEHIGRKLIGGVFDSSGGGGTGELARDAPGDAIASAAVYAVGHTAGRYCVGGRTMNQHALQETFNGMLSEARRLLAQYAPRIERQARAVDVNQIVQVVRYL